MQLALEMSVREEPEAVQIEVAKQISLSSCPLQSSPADVVAFRYWLAESNSTREPRSRFLISDHVARTWVHQPNASTLHKKKNK